MTALFLSISERYIKLASVKAGLAIATFPMESPFTTEQTLDEDFLPEG